MPFEMDSTISIHAPREGGDSQADEVPNIALRFQSTPPGWGATLVTIEKRKISDYFNPRPPRGGRLARYRQSFHGNTDFNPRPPRGGRHRGGGGGHVSAEISIHAPREGGDLNAPFIPSQTLVFQSTPPARGATITTSIFPT